MQSVHCSGSQQDRELFTMEPTTQTEGDYQKYSISTGSECSSWKINMIHSGSSLTTI